MTPLRPCSTVMIFIMKIILPLLHGDEIMWWKSSDENHLRTNTAYPMRPAPRCLKMIFIMKIIMKIISIGACSGWNDFHHEKYFFKQRGAGYDDFHDENHLARWAEPTCCAPVGRASRRVVMTSSMKSSSWSRGKMIFMMIFTMNFMMIFIAVEQGFDENNNENHHRGARP